MAAGPSLRERQTNMKRIRRFQRPRVRLASEAASTGARTFTSLSK